jgi:hypothetical protein
MHFDQSFQLVLSQNNGLTLVKVNGNATAVTAYCKEQFQLEPVILQNNYLFHYLTS